MKKLFNYIYYFVLSVKNRGLVFTFRLIYNEWYWERELGIKSMKIELLPQEVRSDKFKNEQFHHYQGASYYITMETLRNIPNDALSSGFLDFGCGKGRVMVIAAMFGFRRVSGIDMDENLLKIAKLNTDLYSQGKAKNVKFFFENVDAAKYFIPSDTSVLFFFNPFGKKIMLEVIKNLKEGVEYNSRKIWIVYVNPKFLNIWIDAGFREVYRLESKHYKESVILEFNK